MNADADADVIVDVNVDVDVDAPPVSRPWLEVPVSRTAEYFRRAGLERREEPLRVPQRPGAAGAVAGRGRVGELTVVVAVHRPEVHACRADCPMSQRPSSATTQMKEEGLP